MKFFEKCALVFLGIYCFALARPLLPFAEYALKYEYISETLCINKDHPEMQCHGKCHLSKQLLEHDDGADSEQQLPSSRGSDLSYSIGLLAVNEICFAQLRCESLFSANDELNLFPQFVAEILHPPEV